VPQLNRRDVDRDPRGLQAIALPAPGIRDGLFQRRIALGLELRNEQPVVSVLVVDDQYPRGFLRFVRDFSRMGKYSAKVLPLPGSLSTSIVPPCSAASRRASAVPWANPGSGAAASINARFIRSS